jgi:hypothetical protein
MMPKNIIRHNQTVADRRGNFWETQFAAESTVFERAKRKIRGLASRFLMLPA